MASRFDGRADDQLRALSFTPDIAPHATGGTRTAAITGGCVAMALACARLVATGKLAQSPIRRLIAAVSVGIVNGVPVLDLNYEEDKAASVDLNVVLTDDGHFVEVQG